MSLEPGWNPKTHKLKTWPQYFDAVMDGSKRFEVRKDDRFFQVGDFLWLEEWSPEREDYTGRKFYAEITYKLTAEGSVSGALVPGYCVLSIREADWP